MSGGARSVPREYLEVAAAYRAHWRSVWFDITLMSAVPYLIAAFGLVFDACMNGVLRKWFPWYRRDDGRGN